MTKVETYVFFDIETTGLPFQERNKTKIIEASFVAAIRHDIEDTEYGFIPPVSKLTFVLNPKRKIHREVTQLTGLSNKLLNHAPMFKQKFPTLLSFLNDLPKPVCLVAHNGNSFDYKILLAECVDAQVNLPRDLLCVDSLVGFRKLLKNSLTNYESLNPAPQNLLNSDIFTDDEDDWPDLDVSPEQWYEIDELCLSVSDVSFEEETEVDTSSQTEESKSRAEIKRKKENERENVIKKVFRMKSNDNVEKESYKLTDLYKRLLNKEEKNAHRAEVDCMMLLECVVSMKSEFLPWVDEACKLLTCVKPLVRY